MLTINFADDLTNPPEHLHLPTASSYTAVMFPAGPASYGHMTLAHPAVWASALGSFLQRLLPALPIQVALAAEGIAASAHARTPQATSKPAGPPNPLFPDDAEFWYETPGMLGADEYGAGSFGEVLAICRQIKAGDYDSRYDAWNAAADGLAGEADGQLARGHKVGARDNYLRAANNYRSSEFFLHATPKDPSVVRAYGRQIKTYKAAARLFDVPVEPVEIPYEATSLPGYFHRVDQSDRPRPLLIMHTGFDGSAEEKHWSGAGAAVARGYNVLAFDGPGQSGPLHREDLPFRLDWEKVVTPVVDYALKQTGVDLSRIALLGSSMGGELAPRAAAFEHRIAACIANDGLYDFAAAFLSMIPPAQNESFVAMINAPAGPRRWTRS
jgi:hypothetical protein